jgi:hypothetical protein
MMFNTKRIEELESSVRALKCLVDMQQAELKGYRFSAWDRSLGLVDKVKMLEDYLEVDWHTTPTAPATSAYNKIKKEKK